MTDQLSIYNGALMLCGERALASITENRKSCRLLNGVWDRNGVKNCLEEGFWNFATRAVRVDYDPSIEPEFGYRYGFPKEDDYVKTSAFCSDEDFNCPVTQYSDEDGFWFCDLQTVFIKYISTSPSFGFNYAGWPETFTRYVEAHFADKIVFSLTQSGDKQAVVEKALKEARSNARSKDAMNQPTAFRPVGSWVRARMGSGLNRNGRSCR